MMDKIRVAICDDMKQVRDYFSALISSEDDMEVVGTASNGNEIYEIAKNSSPNIILMDIQMESECAGIIATKRILENFDNISIIITTVHENDNFIFEAFVAGAVDYLLKTMSATDINTSIRNAYAHNTTLHNNIASKVLSEFTKMKKEKVGLIHLVNMMCNLSPVEVEVLTLLCKGLKRREIADHRYVELVTVNTMIGRIMRKLRYSNSRDLIEDINGYNIISLLENLANSEGNT